MAKHNFRDAYDNRGNLTGVICLRCGTSAKFVDLGKISDDIAKEECKGSFDSTVTMKDEVKGVSR
jgi:hypothetical protein